MKTSTFTTALSCKQSPTSGTSGRWAEAAWSLDPGFADAIDNASIAKNAKLCGLIAEKVFHSSADAAGATLLLHTCARDAQAKRHEGPCCLCIDFDTGSWPGRMNLLHYVFPILA